MAFDDLPAVLAIQAQAYAPCFHEDERTFRSKLHSFPDWAWVAQTSHRKLLAYLFAQPTRLGIAPCLGDSGIPVASPNALHLHDLAVAPEARGVGLAGMLTKHVLERARQAGPEQPALPWVTLVAVQDSLPYWSRHGFAPAPEIPGLHSYGPGATYMLRQV